jgi:acetyl-CoA synthetase
VGYLAGLDHADLGVHRDSERVVYCEEFVEGVEESDELRERIVGAVEEEIGKFARPANVIFVDDLPKTRSGKIMRRLLEDISNDEKLGNTSTLRDPSVPEEIRSQVQAD